MAKKVELTIFLSSPNDHLEEERTKFKDLMSEIVSNSPIECNIDAIKWEADVSKAFNSTFQENIDQEILKSDLVIFMFCNRLGKNTLIEYELCKKLKKSRLITLKEYQPKLSTLTVPQIEDYLKLRKFLESHNDEYCVKYETYYQFAYEIVQAVNRNIKNKLIDKTSEDSKGVKENNDSMNINNLLNTPEMKEMISKLYNSLQDIK